jgi:hypothetical protein
MLERESPTNYTSRMLSMSKYYKKNSHLFINNPISQKDIEVSTFLSLREEQNKGSPNPSDSQEISCDEEVAHVTSLPPLRPKSPLTWLAPTCNSKTDHCEDGDIKNTMDKRGRYKFNIHGTMRPKYYRGDENHTLAHEYKIAFHRLRMKMEYEKIPIYYCVNNFWLSVLVSFERLYKSESARFGKMYSLIPSVPTLLSRVNLFISIWDTGTAPTIYAELTSRLLFAEATQNKTQYSSNLVPQGFMETISSGLLNTDKITDSIGDIKDMLANFTDNNRMGELFELLHEQRTGKLGSDVLSCALRVGILTSICSILVWEFKLQKSMYNKALALFTLVGCYLYGNDLMVAVTQVIAKMRESVPERPIDQPQIVPQVGGDAILTALSSLLLIGSVGSCKNVPTELFRSLSQLDRVKMSLKSIYNFIFEIVKSLFGKMGISHILPEGLSGFYSNSAQIQEFLESYERVETELGEHKFYMIEENFQLLRRMIKEGERILQEVPRDRETSGCMSLISDACRSLRKVRQRFTDANFSSEGMRQEPVALLLRGGPGVLKSQSLEHFANALASRTLKCKELEIFLRHPSRFFYNRQSETKYWDGYDNDKLVTMYDDFGQQRDVAGNPDNEFASAIRNINEFENDLHMADIDSKGNTKFISKFVLFTTNMQDFAVESIIDVNALKRRFTFTYTVVPKPEYETLESQGVDLFSKRIDISKLPEGPLGVSSTNPSVLNFHEYNLFTKQHTGVIHSFEQVCDLVVAKEKEKNLWFEQKKIELRTLRLNGVVDGDLLSPSATREEGLQFLKTFESHGYQREPHYYDGSFVRSVPREFSEDLELLYEDDPVKYEARMKLVESIYDERFDTHDLMLYCITERTHGQMLDSFLNATDVQFVEYVYSLPTTLGEKHASKGALGYDVTTVKYKTKSISRYNFAHKIKEAYVSIKLRIQSFIPWDLVAMGKALTIIGTLGVLYFSMTGLYDYFKEPGCAKVSPTGIVPESDIMVRGGKTTRPHMTARQMKAALGAQPQMATKTDKVGFSILEKVRKKNACEIWVQRAVDLEDYVRYGYILFVKNRIAIMPYHFMLKLAHKVISEPKDANLIVRIKRPSGDSGQSIDIDCTLLELLPCVQQITKWESTDLCLVEFPTRIQPFPNIIPYFTTEQDFQSLKEYNIRLIVPGITQTSSYCGVGRLMTNLLVCPNYGGEYVLAHGMQYNAPTEGGDCGAILTILNSCLATSKIFGFHVAGSPSLNLGHSTLVTQEEVIECIALFPDSGKIYVPFEGSPFVAQSGEFAQNQFNVLYKLKTPVPQATRSKIRRSSLYGKVRSAILAPSRLREFINSDGVRIDPWQLAFAKLHNTPHVVNQHHINQVVDQYRDYLFHVSEKSVEKRLLTYREAIMGTDDPEFGSISRQTSPGYPYVMNPIPNRPGRTRFFGVDVDYNLETPAAKELEMKVVSLVSGAADNVRYEHIFVDCLKDELRPLDKVREGKTRMFSSGPIDLLIAYRMYFGAFTLWYKKNRIFNGSGVGINPFSYEWNVLYNHLLEVALPTTLSAGAGDFSGFDANEVPQIHWQILNIINHWYADGPVNARVRRVLWMELVNSKHVYKDVVYEWHMSLPSGHPLTTIVNTMYNCIAYRYCWFAFHNFDSLMLWDFDKYIRMIALGDDSVFVVHPHYSINFNETTVGHFMALLGLTYTSENKGELATVLRPLLETTFLKRGFRYCNIYDTIVAPLNYERLLEILNWTKDVHFARQITVDNINTVLEELTLHGSNVFLEASNDILPVVQKELNYYPPCTSFDVLYDRIRQRDVEL